MTTPNPNHRWYHLTPARFFVGLLVVQVLLLLSERFQWFPFNAHKGWTVLIAVGVVGVAVLVMVVWGVVCLLFRRRFQFSFRSLLVFLFVVSIPLCWFARKMEGARKQREAVERIVELGGALRYDYEPDDPFAGPGEHPDPEWLRSVLGDEFFCDVVEADVSARSFGDQDVLHLTTLVRLTSLDVARTQVTDRAMEELSALSYLKGLNLDGTPITDAGLEPLKGLTGLRHLSLHGTKITGDGLLHLTGLTNLTSLDLGDTHVSGIGLEHLNGLTKLKSLDLSGSGINDAGLKYLEGMDSLRFIDFRRVNVSDDGVNKLRQSLPKCEIWRTKNDIPPMLLPLLELLDSRDSTTNTHDRCARRFAAAEPRS